MSQVRILSFRPKKSNQTLAVWFDFFAWFVDSKLFAKRMQVRIPQVSRRVAKLPCHSDQKSRIILIRLFLSKPQVWHIITARSVVHIISSFGAVYPFHRMLTKKQIRTVSLRRNCSDLLFTLIIHIKH
jgi:hypothetical protein